MHHLICGILHPHFSNLKEFDSFDFDECSKKLPAYHAMAIVGYNRTHFRLMNSWKDYSKVILTPRQLQHSLVSAAAIQKVSIFHPEINDLLIFEKASCPKIATLPEPRDFNYVEFTKRSIFGQAIFVIIIILLEYYGKKQIVVWLKWLAGCLIVELPYYAIMYLFY